MAKSVSAKAEELARRADEKQKQLNDINRKVGVTPSLTQTGILGKKDEGLASAMDRFETMSEFSSITTESEIHPEENILDIAL